MAQDHGIATHNVANRTLIGSVNLVGASRTLQTAKDTEQNVSFRT